MLLAIVDYDYRVLYVDVGCQGRISDGGVYRHCTFYTAIENGSLNLHALVLFLFYFLFVYVVK